MNQHSEKTSRSLAKTLSWRVIILIIDFFIAYFFTQDLDLASKLALAKFLIASVFYFLHERAWNNVAWGKSSN